MPSAGQGARLRPGKGARGKGRPGKGEWTMLEGDGSAGDVARWVIEANLGDMEDARRFSGLDRNALVPTGDLLNALCVTKYRLTFPSFFCQSSELWLKALSFLVLHNRDFKIVLETVDGRDGRTVRSFAQLYPKLDGPMLDLLRGFSEPSADRVADLGARVERAFALLRAGAG